MWLEQATKPPLLGRCSAPRQSRFVTTVKTGRSRPTANRYAQLTACCDTRDPSSVAPTHWAGARILAVVGGLVDRTREDCNHRLVPDDPSSTSRSWTVVLPVQHADRGKSRL